MLLCGICEVVFDIDVGHQLHHVYPPGRLSEEELEDVAFSAFPDSMSCELTSRSSVRDCSFSFRVRRRVAPGAPPPPHPFLHGQAFCRQRFDERLRRGCEQKSIVLLSFLPLESVLAPLARLVGPTALSYGPDALREIYEDVQRWPPLEWGCRMTLPLLDIDTLSVELPLLAAMPAHALPAAVAAGLPHQGGRREGLEDGGTGRAGGSGGGSGGGHGSAVAAAAAVSGLASPAPTSKLAATALVPAPQLASPAQVATALADELDDSGLLLCLLPQAYGQQEREASPWGDCDCYTPLRGVLQQLWGLWELLLLGAPLMVVAPTPGSCSGAVSALLSLLAPFPYSCDFRPYFTIHDPAFACMAGGALPTAANGLPLLLGVTNMYFLKALPEWANVLSTGHTAATLPPSNSSDQLEEGGGGGNGSGSAHGGSQFHASDSGGSLSSNGGMGGGGGALGGGGGGGRASSSGSSSTGRLGAMLRRRPATPAALLSEAVDHCWMAYKPCTRPDKTLLDRLVQPQPSDPADKWRRLAAVNSAMLRRHFQELTKALLFPLLPFVSPCLPPPPVELGVDPKAAPSDPPPLPVLDMPALLERMASRDAILPEILLDRFGGQRSLLLFYERFLRSPNLSAWLQQRRLAAAEWQRQEWAAAAAAAAAPLQEVLSVEAFFHLEQQLAAVQQRQRQASSSGGEGGSEDGGGDGSGGGGGAADAESTALAAQLQQQLQLAFGVLPEDLQEALLQTPSHAALLGSGQQPAGAAAAAAAGAAAGGAS